MKTHLTQGLKNKGRDYKENALRVQHWFLHSNHFCSCSKSALLAIFLLSGWKMDVAIKVKSIHFLCLNRFCREHSTSIKNKKVKVISNRRLDKINHLNINFFSILKKQTHDDMSVSKKWHIHVQYLQTWNSECMAWNLHHSLLKMLSRWIGHSVPSL